MIHISDLINRTSIRPQLFITVAIGIIFLLIALIFASTWVSNQQVQKVLINQSKQATSNLSKNTSLALLYDSPDNAETAIQATLAFPGVTGITIYKSDKTLFCGSDQNIGTRLSDKSLAETLDVASINLSADPQIIYEDKNDWIFLAPVSIKARDQPMQEQLFSSQITEKQQLLGYVFVTSSKASLKNISKGILLTNSVIAFFIGLLLLFALQKTIKRLTQPLYSISDVMQKTEQGEYASQVACEGPQEVHHIAAAYNRMINALAERDETLRKQNVHLEKQAIHDHLTRLINRIGFEQALNLAIEECKTLKTQHALCYMDLDKFKIVNDSCGHNAGDELLQNVSKIFKHHIRKDSDTLARVGGDEFALILKNCSLEKARSIGENICKDIKNYRFDWDDKVFSIGVSIGITQLDENAGNLHEVISKVDSACYAAKERGRDQVFVIQPGDEALQTLSGQTQIANQIIDHLDNNKFELFCQTIKSLKDSDKTKPQYEILLRMTDNSGENIPPHKFISAAERYDLMSRIDQWVIRQTLKQLSTNKQFTDTLDSCTINISASSVNNEQFIEFIKDQFRIFDINPHIICFEITETTTINNISKAEYFIQCVHQLGCRIALDDFVSNSSSFAHIKNMNIDYLKIHGDFFKDFIHNPVNHAMAKSINEIAHILHIKTIAVHIDDNEKFNELINIGIDYAQGFVIAKPVSLNKLCKQLSVNN